MTRPAPGRSGANGADDQASRGAGLPGDKVLRNVVSAVADGIVVVDAVGTVIFANPAAQELFGRPFEALVGAEFGFPLVAGETTEIDLLMPGAASRVVEMRVTETIWEAKRVH